MEAFKTVEHYAPEEVFVCSPSMVQELASGKSDTTDTAPSCVPAQSPTAQHKVVMIEPLITTPSPKKKKKAATSLESSAQSLVHPSAASKLEEQREAVSYVYVSGCGLMSTMMIPWVFSLRMLKVLDLSNNGLGHLGGAGVWSTCFNLMLLDLENNKLQGINSVVESIAHLPSLTILSTRGNPLLTDCRHELIERLPTLVALDRHIIADSERWNGVSGFSQVAERFRPLSVATRLTQRGGENPNPLDDIQLLQSLPRRIAILSPATQIQRVWKGHAARTLSKALSEQRRWAKRGLSAAVREAPARKGTGTYQLGAAGLFSAADALMVMKRSIRVWLRKRAALIEAVQKGGIRSIVIRASEAQHWSMILKNLEGDKESTEEETATPAEGDTGNNKNNTSKHTFAASMRPLETYRMLRVHPHLVSTERRETPLPHVVESRCVITPNLGRKDFTKVQGVDKRTEALHAYTEHVMPAADRNGAVRAAVRLNQAHNPGGVATSTGSNPPTITTSHPLAVLTVLNTQLIGKLIHHAVIFNNMRRGTQHPITFYFPEDLERLSAAAVVQSWFRGVRIRKAVRNKFKRSFLVDPVTNVFYPAVQFYVLRLQCCWRRIIATRRTRFLKLLKDLATIVVRRAEDGGKSTACHISGRTITEMARMTEYGGRSVGLSYLPEQQALLHGMVHQGAASGEAPSLSASLSSRSAPKTSHVYSAFRLGITLRHEAYDLLPGFLKSHFLPSSDDGSAVTIFSPLDLLVKEAQIQHYSYPDGRNMETKTTTGLVAANTDASPQRVAQPRNKYGYRRRSHSSISPSPNRRGSSPNEPAITPDSIKARIVSLAQQHPHGHLSLLYQDTRESICRRLALVVLSYSFNDESYLCFEARQQLVSAAAVARIESWWLRNQWKVAGNDRSLSPSLDGGSGASPYSTTSKRSTAAAPSPHRSLAPPTARLYLGEYKKCPDPFAPVPRVKPVKPDPQPIKPSGPQQRTIEAARERKRQEAANRKARSTPRRRLSSSPSQQEGLSSIASQEFIATFESNRQHYISNSPRRAQVSVMATLGREGGVKTPRKKKLQHSVSPNGHKRKGSPRTTVGDTTVAGTPVEVAAKPVEHDAVSQVQAQKRVRGDALKKARNREKTLWVQRRQTCAVIRVGEKKREEVNPSSLKECNSRSPRTSSNPNSQQKFWKAASERSNSKQQNAPEATPEKSTSTSNSDKIKKKPPRYLQLTNMEYVDEEGVVKAEIEAAAVLRVESAECPKAVLHRVAIEPSSTIGMRGEGDVAAASTVRFSTAGTTATTMSVRMGSVSASGPTARYPVPQPPTPRPVVVDTVTELPCSRCPSTTSQSTAPTPAELNDTIQRRHTEQQKAAAAKAAMRSHAALLDKHRKAETRAKIKEKLEADEKAEQERLHFIRERHAKTVADKKTRVASRLAAKNCHRPLAITLAASAHLPGQVADGAIDTMSNADDSAELNGWSRSASASLPCGGGGTASNRPTSARRPVSARMKQLSRPSSARMAHANESKATIATRRGHQQTFKDGRLMNEMAIGNALTVSASTHTSTTAAAAVGEGEVSPPTRPAGEEAKSSRPMRPATAPSARPLQNLPSRSSTVGGVVKRVQAARQEELVDQAPSAWSAD